MTSPGTSRPSATTDLRVSAVICTYTEGRWDLIVDAIASLRAQTRPADEILIVVDYNELLAVRLRREVPDVRVVENHHTQGLSGAKNTALEVATGDILAVLDDDATAEPHWLETLVGHFASAEVVAAGSASVPRWEDRRPTWFAPELDWTVGCSYQGLPEEAAEVRNVFGGAMALRRVDALEAGGFRTEMGRVMGGYGGAEETEFCVRLAASRPEARIVYDPRSHIDHRVPAERARWSYVWRRCYGEGVSKATMRRLTQAHTDGSNPLGTERNYVVRTVPAALWRDLRRGRIDAAAALAAAVATTTAGYLVGMAEQIGGLG